MNLRPFIVIGAVILWGSSASADELDGSLQKAVSYLMRAQHKDGGWHSATYGSMRQGASVTALVLNALGDLPPQHLVARAQQVERGFEFLRSGIHPQGFVANPDGTVDFPTYATAMALSASARLRRPFSANVRRQLVAYLVAAQLCETRGFRPAQRHYGGWDLMGNETTPGQTTGSNISLTRFVMEALAGEDDLAARTACERAGRWVAGCQNFPQDGGFFFNPDVHSHSNKAQWQAPPGETTRRQPRSYGTTTCDGIQCMVLAGSNPQKQRLAAALDWIEGHLIVNQVPGFEDLPAATGWEDGLRFYYYASLARVLPLLSQLQSKQVRADLATELVSRQRPDGSWKNGSARMREDDPLIGTSLAIMALGRLLSRESSRRTMPARDASGRR